jgi:hypothetical protein
MNFKEYGCKLVLPNLTQPYYPCISMEPLGKSGDPKGNCPGRYLNWCSLEYKSEVLPFEPTFSGWLWFVLTTLSVAHSIKCRKVELTDKKFERIRKETVAT